MKQFAMASRARLPRHSLGGVLLTLSATALLAGCGKTTPPPQHPPGKCEPPPLEVFLQADERLNLNALGQAQPVEVRVLLLKDRQRLDRADFETVWKDTASLLGDDLVSSASLTVFPGKLKIYPMKSAPGVVYVALIGLFRQPQRDGWRYIVNIQDTNSRCADSEELHSIVHALLRESTIVKPN